MRSLFRASSAALALVLGSMGALPVNGSFAATDPAPTAADNEAAAKHARLTACLKEAKTKKLVGAQKAEFLRSCSASR